MQEPRPHHYRFAHRRLPETLLHLHAGRSWATFLLGPQAQSFLEVVWKAEGEGLAPEQRLDSTGLGLQRYEEEAGVVLVLITLPPAVGLTEAIYLAIVIDKSTGQTLRFVTLEMSFDLTTQSAKSVLCEWTPEGHIHFGERQAQTPEQFLEVVRQHLLGQAG